MRINLGDEASANVTPEAAKDPAFMGALKQMTDAVRKQFTREGYRMLEVGEVMKEGDEVFASGEWSEITASVGVPVHPDYAGTFRRPLTKGEA